MIRQLTMSSHANLGPRDVWGAASRGPAEARSSSFPLEFKTNGTKYLSLTGGPGVYIKVCTLKVCTFFFWYWKYGRTESLSMYGHVYGPFLLQGPVWCTIKYNTTAVVQ